MPTKAPIRGSQRAEHPPTDRLLRVTPFAVRSAAEVDGEEGDGLTLDGYAAVFNRKTLIDSWEGRFWEEIAPGAMKKTFREQTPKVQFDHGTHPMIGSMPIGAVRSIAEEVDAVHAPEGGAHIVARLFDNWLIEPVRDAIREQAINGMSFRFSVVKEEWYDADGKRMTKDEDIFEALYRSWRETVPEDELLTRRLREVRVPELGPVVFPAYSDTMVQVRSGRVTIDLAAVRAGEPVERRKLADLLFMADSRSEFPDSRPGVEGTVEDATDAAPQVTEDTSADEHAEQTEDAEPEGTARAAAAHSQNPRRDLDIALSDIRQRVLQMRQP